MPINLDHVGLNTLIQEPVDQEQNTIGYKKRKALRMPSTSNSITGIITGDVQSTYPSSGYLSISFWVKLDNGYNSNNKFILEADDNSNNNAIIVLIGNDALKIEVMNISGVYIRHETSTLSNLTSWNHFVVIIDIDAVETIPIVYQNGAPLSPLTVDAGSGTGAMRIIAGRLALMGNDTATDNSELQGSLQEFAFYNKSLNQDEINEIYEAYELTKTSLNSNIIDYWKLGEEQEFEDFNEGESVTDGLSFNATIGSTSLTIDENIFISSGYTNPLSYRNSQIASIPSGSYLAALNIHRNGPYGWPIFKQTRIGQNPLTRYQNRNSIFTYVTEIGDVKLLKQDGKLIDTFRERRSNLRQIIESPVVSNYKPLTLVGSTEVESIRGGRLSKQRIEIKTTFSNENTYFADDQTTREHGVELETVEEYEDFVDLYLDGGLDSDDSPFDEFEMLRFDQTIFPAPGNMYLNQVRSREEFINTFWRNSYDNRVQENVENIFGFIIPSQSMWPLDYINTNLTNSVLQFSTSAGITDLSVPQGYQWKQVVQKRITGSFASGMESIPFDALNEKKGSGILTQLSRNYYLLSPREGTLGNPGADLYYDDMINPGPILANPNNCETFSASFNPFSTFTTGKQNVTGAYDGWGSLPAYSGWSTDVESGKTPFYDSYSSYSELIRSIGNDYSIIPEFKISDHISDILNYGVDTNSYANPLFDLKGAKSIYNDSSKENFYKIYSNSDFLQNFELIQDDNDGFVNPLKIKLKCKAIKKFLPYEDFYPAQRTVTLSSAFYNNIVGKTNISSSSTSLVFQPSKADSQFILNCLYSPGVLYNTIKSGVAVDFPVHSDLIDITEGVKSLSVSTRNTTGPLTGSNEHDRIYPFYVQTKPLKTRVPFEAILEPGKYLSNKMINTLHPTGEANYGGIIATFKTDPEYYLMANNFLSETADFFLKSENYTTIASLPEGDPNFGNAQSGSTYMMRLKMYRSISGSKGFLTSSNGIKYIPPQDYGDMKETFSMYSRPTAFGTHCSSYLEDPTDTYSFEAWKEYKFDGCYNFSYNTGSYAADGVALSDFEVNGNHCLIGNPVGDGYNYIFTPPYYHGEAWADFTFKPTESKKYSLNEILENSSVEFYRYYDTPLDATTYSAATDQHGNVHYRLVNESAMQLPSSVNIKSKGMFETDRVSLTTSDAYRWIIQTKFETPMINFNHINYEDVPEIPMGVFISDGVTYTEAERLDLQKNSIKERGIWKQYGRLPETSNIGVFMQVEDLDSSFIEGPMNQNPKDIKSLRQLCGFSNNASRLGEVKESKVIKEAIVAIPFLEREGERKFFTLDRKDIDHALKEETQKLVGQTVVEQVQRMQEYIFPPSMDFIRNDDIEPFAMYIFEFSHTLSKQDLADIWQNLSPDIGTSHEVAEATVSHELLAHELLGDGAKLKFTSTLVIDEKHRINKVPSDIRWMVFKVKKRAASNYFEKIYERNESGFGSREKLQELSATSIGTNVDVQYNWPYDYFSLVELVKIDAQIDFAVPDDTQDTLTIKRRKKVKQVDTTPTENAAAINNALFGTGVPLTSPVQTTIQEPVEPNPLGNIIRRRNK